VETAADLHAALIDREATVVRIVSDRDRNVQVHDALHAGVATRLSHRT
jgi:hypothetical protein